jgi:hypothetical protein
VLQVIMKMLTHSRLYRDSDLRKRLDVTSEAHLEVLAGLARAQPERLLRDVSGRHGTASVHVGQQWMFDVLPPNSIADRRGPGR